MHELCRIAKKNYLNIFFSLYDCISKLCHKKSDIEFKMT